MIGYGSGDEATFETAAVVATLVGILGGPVMWVTVPLGARWAYDRSRTDTTAAP